MRSLSARLVVVFLLPLVASAAVALVLTVRTIGRYERDRTEQQLRTQAPAVATLYGRRATSTFGASGEPITLQDEIVRITDATIFYVPDPSADFPLPGGNVATWKTLRLDWKLLGKGATQSLEATPPGRKGSYLIVASGVRLGKKFGAVRPGAIVLARPLSALQPGSAFLSRRLLPAFLIGAGVAVMLALAVGIRLTLPLRRLVAATAAIARGNYDVRLNRRRRDEIGKLNRAFGAMADELQATKEHERLFLMRVSHELRTPLTAIQGHVGALADGVYETEDDRAAAVAVVASESARLARLIRDLLDLAKLEAHRFTLNREEVDLTQLLESAALAHATDARARGIELTVDVDRAPSVMGDGDRILQIVSNLLANALRWVPDGGAVRLSARAVARGTRIDVADSGPGVPAEKRRDVFRPFFSEDGAGTGLGLAIASELAVAMGGRLTVGDAPEGGALFRCELPRALHAGAVAPLRV